MAVENGYGWEEDLEYLEENGCMDDADSSKVSDKAKKRGIPQLGSLGSGNHSWKFRKLMRYSMKMQPQHLTERGSGNSTDPLRQSRMRASDLQ
jgi:RNA-splicing ligase RtcB